MENFRDVFNALVPLFNDGYYDDLLRKLGQLQVDNRGELTPIEEFMINRILNLTLIKANYSDEACYHGVSLVQAMFAAAQKDEELFKAYFNLLKSSNIVQIGWYVQRQLRGLLDQNPDYSSFYQTVVDSVQASEPLGVFPIVWPVAFGDMIIVCQFILQYLGQNKKRRTILIMPLNRPDLKQVAELLESRGVIVVDITLMQEEADRLHTLTLTNGNVFNVSIQEYIINKFLYELRVKTDDIDIVKLRYLPYIEHFKYRGGFRIWEERAKMWLKHHQELPKLVPQRYQKTDSIVVHFREATYADDSRNINLNKAQDLIDELKTAYPGYEIVRLGDKSMTPLLNCRNASHEDLDVLQQIELIQKAKLAICSHSAVQHLVVACSDTPVICIHYVTQETCTTMDDSIGRMSYEALGEQVKATLYNKMYDKDGAQIVPQQNNQSAVEIVPPSNGEIMQKVKEVLA